MDHRQSRGRKKSTLRISGCSYVPHLAAQPLLTGGLLFLLLLFFFLLLLLRRLRLGLWLLRSRLWFYSSRFSRGRSSSVLFRSRRGFRRSRRRALLRTLGRLRILRSRSRW